MASKIVYLMRGLPSCGKSFTARRIAGKEGIVLETDAYFYTQVGDCVDHYDYDPALLPAARHWNLERFRRAVADRVTPIVIDRGNGRNRETQQYARHAVEHGYEVALQEPESEWWQEIRVLLKYKSHNRDILDSWADRLADISRQEHRVPAATIREWMNHWKWDLTVDDILNWRPSPKDSD